MKIFRGEPGWDIYSLTKIRRNETFASSGLILGEVNQLVARCLNLFVFIPPGCLIPYSGYVVMDKESRNSHAVCIAIFLSLLYSLAIYVPMSYSFVLDKFERSEGGTIKRDTTERKKRNPDPSCVTAEMSNISQFPSNRMKEILNGMGVEKQVDIYLCANRAGMGSLSEQLMALFLGNFPRYFEYLVVRLGREQDEDQIEGILAIFAGHGFADYQSKIKENGDLPTYDELFFKADTARFLVKKAETLKNEKARCFFLNYLIPLLPYDEAVARQAQREEAQKKSGK